MTNNNDLIFTITFHSPFLVSSGQAADGVDHLAAETIPSSELKGLLRSRLIALGFPEPSDNGLGNDVPLISRIFGSARHQSSWIFTDAVEMLEEAKPAEDAEGDSKKSLKDDTKNNWDYWVRVALEGDGKAKERALVIGEQRWVEKATFTVSWNGAGDADEDREKQALALRAAARSISSLGLNRRRGMGWVTVEDDKKRSKYKEWNEKHSVALIKLAEQERKQAGNND